MSCPDSIDPIFSLEATPAEAHALYEHLDGCTVCREAYDRRLLLESLLPADRRSSPEKRIRQTLAFSDLDEGGSSWGASTTGFVDYHFDMDEWQPFVGAFIGYAYGDDVDEDGVWGPEGGVKYFVNSTTYIGFAVQYVIGFDSDSDEFFNYQLALGFKK